mmetsp:Transcript_6585/g.14580  ORF Transcript_6585/g.14580 Transcript_6585/m.14580 type:complete len:98 (+) Transcript_6585:1555-1848(+)
MTANSGDASVICNVAPPASRQIDEVCSRWQRCRSWSDLEAAHCLSDLLCSKKAREEIPEGSFTPESKVFILRKTIRNIVFVLFVPHKHLGRYGSGLT